MSSSRLVELSEALAGAASTLPDVAPSSVSGSGRLSVSGSIVAAAKRGDPIEVGRLLMDAARDGRATTQEDFDAVVVGCVNIGDLDRADSWLHLMQLAGGSVSESLVRKMLRTLWARRRVEREVSARQISHWFLRLYFEDRVPITSATAICMLRRPRRLSAGRCPSHSAARG